MSVSNLLDDYAPEDALAKSWSVDRRTIARYRNEPNGLPFMKLGGKVYIHIPGAKEWIRRRTLRRNPISGTEDRR
jgi:hypothetical protein